MMYDPAKIQFILWIGIVSGLAIVIAILIRKFLVPYMANSIEHPEMHLWEKSQKLTKRIARCSTAKDFATLKESVRVFEQQNKDKDNIHHYVYTLYQMIDKAQLKVV